MTKLAQDTKSPVYGYLQKPTMVDFPGRMATVMFTSGCNFRCGFCHNAPIMGTRREGLEWTKLEKACRNFQSNWVTGVVISGGEPTLWEEKLIELIDFLKNLRLAIKLDTNGSRPDVLEQALPKVDYVSMDVKCSLANYLKLVGFKHQDKIQQSIELIKQSGVQHEFRTTVIEHFHSDCEMKAIADLIQGAEKYILQPFVPRDNLPDEKLRTTPRTSPDRLKFLREKLQYCAQSVEAKGVGL